MFWPASTLFPISECLGKGFGAGVVETHAINDGSGIGRAEHAGRGIAGLRVPGNAAEFAKAETKFFPNGNGGGKFIHAGGKSDRVGKFQAKNLHGKMLSGKKTADGSARSRIPAGSRKN